MVPGWLQDGSRMVPGWFQDGSRIILWSHLLLASVCKNRRCPAFEHDLFLASGGLSTFGPWHFSGGHPGEVMVEIWGFQHFLDFGVNKIERSAKMAWFESPWEVIDDCPFCPEWWSSLIICVLRDWNENTNQMTVHDFDDIRCLFRRHIYIYIHVCVYIYLCVCNVGFWLVTPPPPPPSNY